MKCLMYGTTQSCSNYVHMDVNRGVKTQGFTATSQIGLISQVGINTDFLNFLKLIKKSFISKKYEVRKMNLLLMHYHDDTSITYQEYSSPDHCFQLQSFQKTRCSPRHLVYISALILYFSCHAITTLTLSTRQPSKTQLGALDMPSQLSYILFSHYAR